MPFSRHSPLLAFAVHLSILLPLFSFLIHPIFAVEITYCSSQNTGAGSHTNTSQYQSVGNCQAECGADYAFGILQSHKCWCSNYAPGITTKIEDCNTHCPGYKQERCGDLANNLFGYIELDNTAPSGTAPASSSSTSSTSTATDGSGSETITAGPTNTGGSHKSGLGGGGIAGIVVGCVGGAALVAGFAGFLIARRRSAKRDASQYDANNMLPTGARHTNSSTTTRIPTAFTDNRLKPEILGRRNSNASLQDNEDYSRPVLRLTNPD